MNVIGFNPRDFRVVRVAHDTAAVAIVVVVGSGSSIVVALCSTLLRSTVIDFCDRLAIDSQILFKKNEQEIQLLKFSSNCAAE